MGETGRCRLGGAVGTKVGGRIKDLGAAPQTGQLGQATRGCQRQRGAHPRGCRALLRGEKWATGDSPCPGASGARTRARGHACLPGCMWAQWWATCSPRPRGLGTSQVPAESRDSSGLSPPSPGSKANPTAAARARSKATAPSSPTPPSAPPPAPRRSLLSGLQSRATAPQAGWSELHA